MSAPWEKYQVAESSATPSGPWSKYGGSQPAAAPLENPETQPTFGQNVMDSLKQLSPTSILPNLTPEKMSTQAPVLGAVGGEMLAGPPGAAIGAGTGQIIKRMADIGYGRVQPSEATNPLQEAIGPMAQTAVAGFPGTTTGEAIFQKVGKGLAKVGQAFSGAKASDLEKAAAKGYSTYGALGKDEASQNFGAALEKAGINTTPTLESTLDPQLTQARQTAMDVGQKAKLMDLPIVNAGAKEGDAHAVFAYNQKLGPGFPEQQYFKVFGDSRDIEAMTSGKHVWGSDIPRETVDKFNLPISGRLPNANSVTPQEALQGRQAVDRIIASTPQKDKPTLLALGNLRGKFNSILSDLSPETAQASRDYADSILKENLTKVMPVNKSGEYSKLAPYLAAAAGSAVGFGHHNTGEGAVAGGAYLLGTSPLAMGAVATTMGMVNPTVRQAILSEFINRVVVGKKGGTQ